MALKNKSGGNYLASALSTFAENFTKNFFNNFKITGNERVVGIPNAQKNDFDKFIDKTDKELKKFDELLTEATELCRELTLLAESFNANNAGNLSGVRQSLTNKFSENGKTGSEHVETIDFGEFDAVDIFEGMDRIEERAKNLANFINADISDVSKMFGSAVDKMITGSKSFSDVMKSLVDDLCSYFIRQFTQMAVNGLINPQTGSVLSGIFSTASNVFSSGSSSGLGGMLVSGIKSLFGSHHSGGMTASGYGLPGTNEYISVLKGGERVLSPAENVSYSNGNDYAAASNPPVVVNSFNIKAWDSKDVKRYLTENKSLIAGITAENIKNNSSNLRQLIKEV